MTTRHLGVIGWPVAHSLSPRLHQYWLRQHNIDATYTAIPVEPENLPAFLSTMTARGMIGANVTIPHKETVFQLIDSRDPIATRIGAINTIIVTPDGTLRGTNTDAYGFAENLRQGGHVISSGAALVLGAGGAARAILAALQDAQCPRIILTNRTPERSEALARAMNSDIETISWEARATILPAVKLLINTTSLGMVGQEPLTLDLSTLPPDATVNDLVYKPLRTPLLQAAAARNLRAIDGLGMLLYQAQASFHHWFDVKPAVTEELRDYMLAV